MDGRRVMAEGQQEIEQLGPGLGYRVRVLRGDGMVIELGKAETMDEALRKLNGVKEALDG